MKLNAKELRDLEEQFEIPDIKRHPAYLIVDNVYDTYNVGGLFRLADGLAIEKLFLCGMTETPPNHKIKKASIGTYKLVPWEYADSIVEVIKKLRKEVIGIQIYAIEQAENSVDYTQVSSSFPFALIVGNETSGISQEVMNECDAILEIPMFGVNKSLNVIVSAAIVAYNSILRISPAKAIKDTPAAE